MFAGQIVLDEALWKFWFLFPVNFLLFPTNKVVYLLELLFDVCFMVDFWKILPNNSASVWFGVLFWVVTNGYHESGSEARRDVTCNASGITSPAITTSSRALCHSSRNLIINCDLYREKENIHL